MTTKAAPRHGVLDRAGAKTQWIPPKHPPRWHSWSLGAGEAIRAERFMRRKLRLSTGAGAGELMRIPPFQRRILTTLYASLFTVCSVPAGNGKTRLMAAIGLERICRGDEFARVDVLATRREQAGEVLAAAKEMVEYSPLELAPLFAWYEDDQILEYRPTGSRMIAQPARLRSVEGLNYSLALVDEIGFAQDSLVYSILARLGKRPDARVLGMGTPGFTPNMLHALRELHRAGELPRGASYLEWAAPEDAELSDRHAWRIANPAIAAGFLREDALEVQAGLMAEGYFRTYHLGQWVEAVEGWLPPGSWEACPLVEPPPRGADVVLAVEGTYKRSMAVAGATLDGSLFLVWSAEVASNEDLRAVLGRAAEKWNVLEVSYPRRIRPGLFTELRGAGLPVEPWESAPENEAISAGEFYGAIVGDVDGPPRLAHDHDALIAEQIERLRSRRLADGSFRFVRPEDGSLVDAALAARAAWWRASVLSEAPSGTPVIY